MNDLDEYILVNQIDAVYKLLNNNKDDNTVGKYRIWKIQQNYLKFGYPSPTAPF